MARSIPRAVGPARRAAPRRVAPGVSVLVTGALSQAVPLYTDWLWFKEVGFTQVFTTRLALNGWLFLGLGGVVFVFLFANLSVAARTAPPDVLWELEDQLGLPGRAILEPLVRRLLLPVISVIALFSAARATAAWDTVLSLRERDAVRPVDPLFGRDLGFFVFELPLWRLVYGWGTALVAGTIVLTAAVYVLQRSLVLTAHGPRLASGARTHLLGLGALLLALRAVGFWLDRYDLLYSPRGIVFGAAYVDVHASLPVLGRLAILALLCAAACVFQIVSSRLALPRRGPGDAGPLLDRRPRRVPVAAPALSRHAERIGRRAAVHPAQHPDDPARVRDRPRGREGLRRRGQPDAAALEKNKLTIDNIRLWDNRPLLVTYGKLQEIRTYYKFLDVDIDRYTVNGESRQVMLSARELSYRFLPSRGLINEHLTYTHGYGLVAGPVNRISPEGLPEFFLKDIPPAGRGAAEDHAAGDLLRRIRQRLRVRADALAGARLSVGRSERLHAVRGEGRHPGQLVPREARVRRPLRRAEDAAVGRPDRLRAA